MAEVYTEAARRQGVELEPRRGPSAVPACTSRATRCDAEQGVHSTDEATERRRWRRIVADVLPEVPDPDRAFDELWDHFGRPESWRCFPDVAPALKALEAAGVSLRIASNFDGRLRGVVRGCPSSRRWLDSLVISSEVGFRKPHPAFYQAACERLGLPPERVLCVGDDLENDVLRGDPRGPFGLSARPRCRAAGRSAACAGPDGAGAVFAVERKR